MKVNVNEGELDLMRADLAARRDLSKTDWDLINFQYYRLQLVDNKTGNLLQYNGIVLATLAILITSGREMITVQTPFEVLFFSIAVLLSFVSTISLLNSISLRWLILGNPEKRGAMPAISPPMSLEFLHDQLLQVTVSRTKVYLRGLWMSRLSGMILALVFFAVCVRGGFFDVLPAQIGHWLNAVAAQR